jgi:hypothetical protein
MREYGAEFITFLVLLTNTMLGMIRDRTRNGQCNFYPKPDKIIILMEIETNRIKINTTANSYIEYNSSIDRHINTDIRRESIDESNRVGRFHPLLRAIIMNKTTKNDKGIALNSTNG